MYYLLTDNHLAKFNIDLNFYPSTKESFIKAKNYKENPAILKLLDFFSLKTATILYFRIISINNFQIKIRKLQIQNQKKLRK